MRRVTYQHVLYSIYKCDILDSAGEGSESSVWDGSAQTTALCVQKNKNVMMASMLTAAVSSIAIITFNQQE